MSIRQGDAGGTDVEPTDTGLPAFVARFTCGRDRRPAAVRPRAVDPRRSPVMVVQPHLDDAALSVGASLLDLTNPLWLVTLYSAALDDAETERRRGEDRECARGLDASVVHLPSRERASLGEARTSGDVDVALSGINERIETSAITVLAPAGVARHVDHLAAHEVGRRLGAIAYWEDVAFWAIYGASVDDRVMFAVRQRQWLGSVVCVGVDISTHLDRKAALLAWYPSQSEETWRPIRYHWTAARELGRSGYCERFFVPATGLEEFERLIGAELEDGPDLRYGTVDVPTRWASTGGARA
jgi:LmbE family N-acetylglucosaminyl deacetylase